MTNEQLKQKIEVYWEIINRYKNNNVDGFSVDGVFAKKFVGFFRVRRNKQWREAFFAFFLELKLKKKNVSREDFAPTLQALANRLKSIDNVKTTIEPSFVSKMLHTINTDLPIWDSVVLSKLSDCLGTKPLTYQERKNCSPEEVVKKVIERDEQVYLAINKWYKTPCADTLEKAFDEQFPEFKDQLGRTKKIDFMLWGKE